MNVNGKIAVITGASSGLGASLAKVLVAKGAIVYGVSRNEKKLSEVKKELGDNFLTVAMDIADRGKLNNWIQQAFSESHLPDILINNAGAGYFAQLDSLPPNAGTK